MLFSLSWRKALRLSPHLPSLSRPGRISSRLFSSNSAPDTTDEMVNTSERLAKLRELMKRDENNVQAYVVPSEDQRQSYLEVEMKAKGETD